jgi:ATP-binding cassette subfamily B protein
MEKAVPEKVNRGNAGGALRFLSARLKKQTPVLILLSLMMAAVSVLSVSMAIFMARAIDAAVAHETKRMFIQLGIMVGVTVAGLSIKFLARLLQTRMSFRMSMALRRSLMERILDRDYEAVSRYHSGDLLNRMTNDTGVVAEAASTILPKLFEFLAKLVFAFVILARYDWMFAVLSLGAAVVVAVFSLFIRPVIKRLHRRMQETEGDTRAFLQETVENQLAVRVFGANDRMLGRVDSLQNTSFIAAMRRRLVSVLAGEGMSFVFTLGVLAALCWGTLSIAGVFGPERTITYGALAAVLQLVSQVQTPFASLTGLIPQFFTMTASCERLMEIESLEREPGSDKAPEELGGFERAAFENVSFSYSKEGSEVGVLDHADCVLERGDFVAVTGISGIGKSTLLKLLLGVYRPKEGSITIETERGEYPADAGTRGLFAYVPQGNLLLSGSIRENVAFFSAEASDEEIMRAARIACAEGFIEELPNGLDTVIGEHGLGLSEGQAQRLAVARALLTRAPVLLLDEATSALDAETEKKLLENLRSGGFETVVIITHKPAALAVCDKELRIENGVIIMKNL